MRRQPVTPFTFNNVLRSGQTTRTHTHISYCTLRMSPPALHPSHPVPLAAKPADVNISISSLKPTTHPSDRFHPATTTEPTLTVLPESSFPAATRSAGPSLPQSYTTQISDLLLSAVVPGIPKSNKKKVDHHNHHSDPNVWHGPSSKREDLNLTSTTGNFRKFVLKVGWLFDTQDFVEEVVFWRRKEWSVGWMIGWGLISFHPHLILMLPLLGTISFLLAPHVDDQPFRSDSHPSPSRSGSPEVDTSTRTTSPPPAQRNSFQLLQGRNASIQPSSTSSSRDSKAGATLSGDFSDFSHEIPPARKGPIETGLSMTYYQNLQGIQNLMGSFSDVYDSITLVAQQIFLPTHPLHYTLIALNVLAIIGVAFGGKFVPTWVILLPLGWGPLLFGLISPGELSVLPLPIPPILAPQLHALHIGLLNDKIPLSLREKPVCELSVWENQRWVRPSGKESIPHVSGGGTTGAEGTSGVGGGTSGGGEGREWTEDGWSEKEGSRSIGGQTGSGEHLSLTSLSIKQGSGWIWIPSETWFIDRVGDWAGGEVDSDGWQYISPNQIPLAPHAMHGETMVVERDFEPGSFRRRRWFRRSVKVG